MTIRCVPPKIRLSYG